MDLRQLQIFMEIVDRGSFTKAAERLLVAQPAVSIAMKKLEEELELVLFNRQGKRISLTAEGEIFLEHARRILNEVSAAETEMEELRGLTRGEVRVGIPPMMSAYFFPRIITQFARRYPNLLLSVHGEGASRIQKMIMQGELDMGVIAGGNAPQALEARHFLREEVVVAVPRDHPLASRPRLTLEEFTAHPLIFYKEGYYLREIVLDVLKEAGLRPSIKFESNLYTLVKSLVKEGLGISTFLRMVVQDEPGLTAIPFDPPLHLDLLIAWKKHSYLSQANRAFVEFLLATCRPSGGPP